MTGVQHHQSPSNGTVPAGAVGAGRRTVRKSGAPSGLLASDRDRVPCAEPGGAARAAQSGNPRTKKQGDALGKALRENPNLSSVERPEALTANDVAGALKSIVLQFPIADVAKDTGSTTRAIENVRAGECGMQFFKIVNACRRNPRFRAQIMALLGCEGETDPDFVQGISLLFNSLARRGGEQ